MRFTKLLLPILSLFSASLAQAQQAGVIVAPEVLVGYNQFTTVYHPNPLAQPSNSGFNTAFQYGVTAGYKLKKWGILADYKGAHYQQNFNQNHQMGDVKTFYEAVGIRILYQLNAINRTNYFHTIKLGYLFNRPQHAHYLNKNDITGEIYADQDQLYALEDMHMLTLEYGITTGYKLLWADFSIKSGVSLNNIYKPLTNVNATNFFIGFQIAFGLFAKTTK